MRKYVLPLSDLAFAVAAVALVSVGCSGGGGRDARLNHARAHFNLPTEDIGVVRRSDGSGTTYIWVDYLAKVSPEWKKKVGVATSVDWPVGEGAKGNEGVAGRVRESPGSIGYIELIYALQTNIKF